MELYLPKQTAIVVPFIKLDELQLLCLQQLRFCGHSPVVTIFSCDHERLDDDQWLNDNSTDMFMHRIGARRPLPRVRHISFPKISKVSSAIEV